MLKPKKHRKKVTNSVNVEPVSPREKRKITVAKSFKNAKEFISSSSNINEQKTVSVNLNPIKKRQSSRSRSITALNTCPKFGYSDQPADVYAKLASDLFKAMELDESVQQTLFHLINKSPEYQRIKGINLCTQQASEAMKNMEKNLNKLEKDQKKQRAALTIQCTFRSYREQIKLKRGLGEFKKTKIQSYHDLCEKEKDFVMNLATLVSQYIVPLRTSSDKHLKKISLELSAVFSDLEKIMGVHQILLKTLYELPRKSWPDLNGLGNVFTYISPHWKIYGTYVHNYKLANNVIVDAVFKNEHFRDFLERGPRGLSTDLTMLLSLPLNHISKYDTYLKSILEETPIEEPEHNSLLQAISITGETANFIKNTLSQAENMATIRSIKEKLISTSESEELFKELLDTSPTFVREIPVEFCIPSKKKPVRGILFLFDTISFSIYNSNKGGSLCNVYHLKDTSIEKSLYTNSFNLFMVDEEKSEYNSVIKDTKVSFTPVITDEIDAIVLSIQNLIAHNQRNRTFGIPIDVLIERENEEDGIPKILKMLTEYIEKDGIDFVGLFRIPGKATAIKHAKTVLNQSNGNYPELSELEFLKPNDAAGLLKMFFNDLPTPLVPHELYNNFISLFPVEAKNLVVLLGDLKALLEQIPSKIFAILRFIISFLVRVAKVKDNKMGPSNLATCFGPNILRPLQQSIESSLAMPKSNSCVEYFIE